MAFCGGEIFLSIRRIKVGNMNKIGRRRKYERKI
jgi:hypothetical protein